MFWIRGKINILVLEHGGVKLYASLVNVAKFPKTASIIGSNIILLYGKMAPHKPLFSLKIFLKSRPEIPELCAPERIG